MKATITSLVGRAPPARKTRTPSAESRSPASARSFHAGVASALRARWSSGQDASRHHAPPGGPIGGAIRPGSPISRRSIESRPTATDARGCGRRPSGLHAHAAPGGTYWGVPWAPSSLCMGPPTNPGRFRRWRGGDVTPAVIRELRDLTRTRTTLEDETTGVVNRIHKVLEDANIKLATVATDIMGVSGRAMLRAIIAGETDPERLADLARR